MEASQRHGVRELFSVNRRGTHWLLVVLPTRGWEIMQDVERVAEGTGDRRSIEAGVETFATLTHPVAAVRRCVPVVRKQLDLVERKIKRRADGTGFVSAPGLTRRNRALSGESTSRETVQEVSSGTANAH